VAYVESKGLILPTTGFAAVTSEQGRINDLQIQQCESCHTLKNGMVYFEQQ